MVVVAFVSSAISRDRRSLVISGILFQCTALGIGGKALYTPWNAMLTTVGVHDELTRFRIHMSLCPLFCAAGVVYLGYNGNALRGVKPAAAAAAAAAAASAAAASAAVAPNAAPAKHAAVAAGSGGGGIGRREMDSSVSSSMEEGGISLADSGTSTSTGDDDHRTPVEVVPTQRSPFMLVVVCLTVQSLSLSVGTTLWPLLVKDVFGWDASQVRGRGRRRELNAV